MNMKGACTLKLEFTVIMLQESRNGDALYFHTNDMLTPMSPFEGPAVLKLDLPPGMGRQYCLENFPEMEIQIVGGL